jgi:hypothetical protein
MSHGEVLLSKEDDPRFRQPVEAPDEEATPEAGMGAIPGEPGLSKVPIITQSLLRDEDEERDE